MLINVNSLKCININTEEEVYRYQNSCYGYVTVRVIVSVQFYLTSVHVKACVEEGAVP